MKCPHCGQEHPDDFKFCPISGQSLAPQTKVCGNPACKYSNVPIEAKFCPRCGTPFSLREENLFNKQRDISLSQIVIFCSRDCSIQIGQGHWTENNDFLREKQLKLKKGENIICVNEYPELQYGFSFNYLDKPHYVKDIILDNFDTSKVTSMANMFRGCGSLDSLNLSVFDTSHVTDMCGMFCGCSSLVSLNLSSFDTSKVTDMGNMFRGCGSLEELALSYFDTSLVSNMAQMFYVCESLKKLNANDWDLSNVKDMSNMFLGCLSLSTIDSNTWDLSNVEKTSNMFHNCPKLFNDNKILITCMDDGAVIHSYKYHEKIKLNKGDNTIFIKDLPTLCYGFNIDGYEYISRIDFSDFDSSHLIDMSFMFAICRSLKSLDLSNFNTSKVTNIYGMFQLCESLEWLDLSGFDLCSLKKLNNEDGPLSVFEDCSSLKKIIMKGCSEETIDKITEALETDNIDAEIITD